MIAIGSWCVLYYSYMKDCTETVLLVILSPLLPILDKSELLTVSLRILALEQFGSIGEGGISELGLGFRNRV